ATGAVSQAGVPVDRSAPSGLRVSLLPRLAEDAVQRCDRLYAGPTELTGQAGAWSPNSWTVIVPVVEGLAFTRRDGAAAGLPAPTEGPLQLRLSVPSPESSGWRLAAVTPSLSAQLGENLCTGGSQVLAMVYHLAYPAVSEYNFSDRGTAGVEGCLLELR